MVWADVPDGSQLALALFGFVFAGFVKGLTGLGFATTALPFLVMALGIERALSVVVLPSLMASALLVHQTGGWRPGLQRFWPMYLATVPGLVAGLWLLASVDKALVVASLGVVLMVYGVWALARPALVLPEALGRRLAAPSGFFTGLINGLTGSQLMPVMPYLMSLGLSPTLFVQAINISFALSSAVMVVGLAKIGFMSWPVAVVAVAAFGPVYLGTRAGGRMRAHLSPELFRRLVLCLLIGLGAALVLRG